LTINTHEKPDKLHQANGWIISPIAFYFNHYLIDSFFIFPKIHVLGLIDNLASTIPLN